MSACPICRLDCGPNLFLHGPEQCRDELAREVARLKPYEERELRTKAIMRECGFDIDEMREAALRVGADKGKPR